MQKYKIFIVVLALFVSVNVLAGCATTQQAGIEESQVYDDNDPIEPFNRAVFAFNEGFDTVLLKPVAEAYRFVFPSVVRNSVRDFLNNLRSPVILANDLLQAEFTRAGETVLRFVINSTFGIGGLFDVAEEVGIEYHNEDFGQTLATWGMGEGFYLVLPILGPSSARDAVGKVVDIFLDPLTYVADNTDNHWIMYSRAIADGIDTRSRNLETLEQLKEGSVDYYASLRSVYRQYRADQISNGNGSAPTVDYNEYEFDY